MPGGRRQLSPSGARSLFQATVVRPMQHGPSTHYVMRGGKRF